MNSSPLVQRVASALGQRFSALVDAQCIDLATAAVEIVRSVGMMPTFFSVLSCAVECARDQWAEMADERRVDRDLDDSEESWAEAFEQTPWGID